MSNKTLIVLVGPTASGKTALAVDIAKCFDTEIVSADSRQFFKELSIGTAKPNSEEMQGVKHHFVDSHSIHEEYNIGKYEIDTLKVLEGIFEKKDVAVLTGGSGLYVRVVCEGMDEIPDTDPDIREKLNNQWHEEGVDVLVNQLKTHDPEFYKQVDLANPIRIIRALEVFYSTGMPFSSFRKGVKKQREFSIIKIGLLWEREKLYDRIDLRMDKMIEQGLFEEARSVYPFKHHNALHTVGYKEIFDFMDGQYDREEAIRLLKRNSRRYAKRQMTWFNKDKEIEWLSPNKETIINHINKRLSGFGN